MTRERLERKYRLSEDADIRAVLRGGRRVSDGYSTLYESGQKNADRFTVIVKRGAARNNPKRNLIKRCIRETYRKNRAGLAKPARDRVLVINNRIAFESSRAEWKKNFLELLGYERA